MMINIAIDGPSAAGKSTIAKALAKKYQYVHLDSGAMYRCVAYKAKLEGIAIDDEQKIISMIENTVIELKPDGSIYLDGKQVNLEIRTNEMSMGASNVSKLPLVREELVRRQQEMAKSKGVIMDGRDIGTVVLKDAEVKIFLTASAKARAERRYKENLEKGVESDLEVLTKEIEARDYQDSHRKHSPLKKADDAIEVDSSNLSIEEVVSKIEEIISKKI
ncbi:MAG: (d)CMP kinase [Anaerorhabdus sp.]|uniref:(d)CMP kinase n=1 Tax=Anaerorhabdus sp. TaxID=1872524 RepID=UPI003A8C6810